MNVRDVPVEIVIGVVSSLITAGILWIFRDKIRQSVDALNMKPGTVLAWVLAFVLVAIQVAFALMGVDVPLVLDVALMTIIGILAFTIGHGLSQ